MTTLTIHENPEVGIEKSIEAKFEVYRQQADEWLSKAKELRVTDPSQTELMEESRTARLALRAIRINIEKLHKREKEDYLMGGRIVDKLKNKFVGLIEPIEAILQDNEDFIEIQEKKAKAELYALRLKECQPLIGLEANSLPLGELSETVYQNMLLGYKRVAEEKEQARLAEIHKQQEQAKKDQEERARIQKENDRLRVENERIAKQQKADREAAQKEKDKQEQKLMKERSERKRLEDEEKARLQNIEDEKKEKASEERKEKRQPDKIKLQTLSVNLKAFGEAPMNSTFVISLPLVKDEEALVVIKQIREMFLKMSVFIDSKAKNL